MRRPRGSRRVSGFTLVEVVVVLVVVGLGVALVAPSLRSPEREREASLAAVVGHARDLAASRGETLLLEFLPGGRWQVTGEASPASDTVASGVLAGRTARYRFALRVAPFGSCGLPLGTDTTPSDVRVETLTCRVVPP